MKIARDLIQKINSPNLTLGAIATEHVWPGLPAVLKNAGLDYLIVDMEHGPYADDLVANVCTSGRQIGMPVLIRTVSTDLAIVRRAIDLGPCGLMFPCVNTVAELDQARDAVWMPPRGKRRPGGMGNHWVSSYHYSSWRDEFEDDLIILPQIETQQGLSNIDEIACHDLTTAVAIGPYDLSADLGCCWQPDDKRLKDALAHVRESASAAGKNVWILGDGPSLQDEGYTFIGIGETSVMLKLYVQDILKQMRGGNEPFSLKSKLAAEHG